MNDQLRWNEDYTKASLRKLRKSLQKIKLTRNNSVSAKLKLIHKKKDN